MYTKPIFQGFEELIKPFQCDREKKNSHFLNEYADFGFRSYESWNFPFDFVQMINGIHLQNIQFDISRAVQFVKQYNFGFVDHRLSKWEYISSSP